MTEIENRVKRSVLTSPAMAGVIGAVGGLLWLSALLVEYRFGLFPPGRGSAFVADQIVFVLAMVCYVVMLLGLRRSGAAGPGRFARTAVALWAAGWVLVALGALGGIVAPDAAALQVLPAIGGLLTCVFGLVTGVLVARAGVWRGWTRWVPLVVAAYVLLALFVPRFLGAEPSLPTEAGWAVGYIILGAALRTAAKR